MFTEIYEKVFWVKDNTKNGLVVSYDDIKTSKKLQETVQKVFLGYGKAWLNGITSTTALQQYHYQTYPDFSVIKNLLAISLDLTDNLQQLVINNTTLEEFSSNTPDKIKQITSLVISCQNKNEINFGNISDKLNVTSLILKNDYSTICLKKTNVLNKIKKLEFQNTEMQTFLNELIKDKNIVKYKREEQQKIQVKLTNIKNLTFTQLICLFIDCRSLFTLIDISFDDQNAFNSFNKQFIQQLLLQQIYNFDVTNEHKTTQSVFKKIFASREAKQLASCNNFVPLNLFLDDIELTFDIIQTYIHANQQYLQNQLQKHNNFEQLIGIQNIRNCKMQLNTSSITKNSIINTSKTLETILFFINNDKEKYDIKNQINDLTIVINNNQAEKLVICEDQVIELINKYFKNIIYQNDITIQPSIEQFEVTHQIMQNTDQIAQTISLQNNCTIKTNFKQAEQFLNNTQLLSSYIFIVDDVACFNNLKHFDQKLNIFVQNIEIPVDILNQQLQCHHLYQLHNCKILVQNYKQLQQLVVNLPVTCKNSNELHIMQEFRLSNFNELELQILTKCFNNFIELYNANISLYRRKSQQGAAIEPSNSNNAQ